VPFKVLAAMVFLLLAGCATTGTAPNSGEVQELQATKVDDPPHVDASVVDEHLYKIPPIDPGQDYVNVWDKVVDRFALPECSDRDINLQWAKWYAERPDYMARIFKRAEPWIHYISSELERRNMPGELALLPIVESAYDPFAYSSGRALGTWQFIADTGRRYGLKQNWWYDGRRDVWSSTQAALEYLSYMHQMFDGDWLLALAGYNTGEGRVARQVKRNQAIGRSSDYWSLSLPRETRGYVPKLLGLQCLFKYPERYNFQVAVTPDEPVIAAVDIGRQADLVLVSQMSQTPIDVLFTLNPGFNRWATSPEGSFRVVLPLDDAARLETQLKAIDPATLMRWDQVVVERGDTLSELSMRHHVPIDVLKTTNRLSGNTIHPGQKLLLPRDDQLLVDPQYAAAAAQLQELQAGLISADRITHTVRPGENLSVIAKRYRVSVAELQRWNNISDPRTLRAGYELVVFHTPTQGRSAKGNSSEVRYVVERGDSLWSIARKYKVKVNDLRTWNSLNKGVVLQPGQKLRIEL
jgi:membrane-bound lytic murein transglycosylase D